MANPEHVEIVKRGAAALHSRVTKNLATLGPLGILLVAAVTVAVWASVADAPWEGSSETAETLGAETVTPMPPSPAFTEQEVLRLVGQMAGSATVRVECFDADFKPQNRMWVVNCTVRPQFGASEDMLFTFDDETGQLGD